MSNEQRRSIDPLLDIALRIVDHAIDHAADGCNWRHEETIQGLIDELILIERVCGRTIRETMELMIASKWERGIDV